MSRAMTLAELGSLLRFISDHHSPSSPSRTGKCVKYVDPAIDMRTGVCFTIKFRCFGSDEHILTTVNEFRDEPECLYDRCMNWLRASPR